MEDSKKILNDFVMSKSQFFNLPDGGEATIKFLGAKPVITNFNGNPLESIRYHFEVNGKEMFWDRTARKFAEQMAQFSQGDLIWIKRTGERNKTKYEVKKVG